MKHSDSEEEVAPRSWISVKSLKEACELKNAYKATNVSSKTSSVTGSPCSNNVSITMEWKPNTTINKSLSFKALHKTYTCFEEDYSEVEVLKTQLKQKDEYLSQLNFKYERDISELNQLILELNEELEKSKKETSYYKKLVETTREEYNLKIQSMQARHERKLQRSKQDFDFLLSDMNCKCSPLYSERTKTSEFSQTFIDSLPDN